MLASPLTKKKAGAGRPSEDVEELQRQLAALVEEFGRAEVLAAVPRTGRRGRPKGSGAIDDSRPLAHMADLLISGRAKSESEAAWMSVNLAAQHSEASAVDRLRRKFRQERAGQLKAAKIRQRLIQTIPPLVAGTQDLLSVAAAAGSILEQQQRHVAEQIQEFARHLNEPAMELVRRQAQASDRFAELVRKSAELLSARPFVWTENQDE